MLNRDDLKGLNLYNPAHFAAVGFGSGLAPKAPGTFGTLAAIPLFYLLSLLPIPYYLLLLVVSSLAGFWFCHVTSKDMGVHDHKAIVWDEFVGYWITMLPLLWFIESSSSLLVNDSLWVVVGFLLFRFFDVVKPFPISYLDKNVHGGIGIMVDDIAAGIVSAALLYWMLIFWG